MKVRYIGESFGAGSGLTNGVVYECLEVDRTDEAGFEFGLMLRIIDDEGPDYWEKRSNEPDGYLYSPINPAPLDGSSPGGKWEIIEDDERGTLAKIIPT